MRTLKFRSYDTVEQSYCPFIANHLDRDLYPHIDVQQWTGLLSKDGVEIYEGDILEYRGRRSIHGEVQSKHDVWTEFRGVVEWSEWNGWNLNQVNSFNEDVNARRGKESFDRTMTRLYFNKHIENLRGEVIGNVYENPELLEANQ